MKEEIDKLNKEIKHLENSREWYKSKYYTTEEYFSKLIRIIEKEGYIVCFNKEEIFIKKKH